MFIILFQISLHIFLFFRSMENSSIRNFSNGARNKCNLQCFFNVKYIKSVFKIEIKKWKKIKLHFCRCTLPLIDAILCLAIWEGFLFFLLHCRKILYFIYMCFEYFKMEKNTPSLLLSEVEVISHCLLSLNLN